MSAHAVVDTSQLYAPGDMVAMYFQVIACLGQGGFGAVYSAKDIRTGADVAIKAEHWKAKFPQLLMEGRVIEYIHKLNEGKAEGIPTLYYCGEDFKWPNGPELHNVMIMQMLGMNLHQYMQRLAEQHDRVSMEDVQFIAREALARLRTVHMAGIAHRDIKPENFLLGFEAPIMRPVWYLVDFGLSKLLVDKTGHMSARRDRQFIGTPKFSAVRSHAGEDLSRRDDLESLVYVLVYLAKGRLPWHGTKNMVHVKETTTPEELFRDLPIPFQETLRHARSLSFEDMPDYDALDDLWARGMHAMYSGGQSRRY